MRANNSIVANNDKPKFSVALMGNTLQNMIAKSVPSKEDAARFTGSLLQVVSSSPQLQNCQPATIVASALRGEGMGLVLGQGYYVVPYKDKASFLISYKGYIQLALATGKYVDIDCLEVREGEISGRDKRTGKQTVDFSVYPTDEERMKHKVVGYYAYFELKDGMFKSEYWSLEKLLEHANRYSVAFKLEDYKKIVDGKIAKSEMWKYSSPWYDTNGGQELMCKKTVLRSLLNSGYAPITNAVRNLINQDMAQEKSDERVVTSDMVKMEQALENNEPIEVVDAEVVEAEVVEEKPKKKATKKTEEVQEEMVAPMTEDEAEAMADEFFK